MQAAGYMAKTVRKAPGWLDSSRVDDVYSVSGCVSKDFLNPVDFWQHNGYWLFDRPATIQQLAEQDGLELSDTQLFYYEVYENEYNGKDQRWEPVTPDASFPLDVVKPASAQLQGFDVVSFSAGTRAECTPLSCNGMARDIHTNQHCLLSSLEEARALLEQGRFNTGEPGPYRIFAVYTLNWH